MNTHLREEIAGGFGRKKEVGECGGKVGGFRGVGPEVSEQGLRAMGKEVPNDLDEVQINSFNFFFNKRQTIILSLLNIITYIGKAF